ncbi:MAG: UDP-N-acetylglucosamine 2-epimerase (non-hydrolyzing) [Candidatus Solibacter usitatus]|nr:UDP-N-acetylglucosamine 2-epimerase (non-hydrolyzing) [Candidatus Solibacter usitatus]
MTPDKILIVFGTRPEAIKLCPLVLHLRERPLQFQVKVCVTAQHRGLLDAMLERFGVEADHDLNVMQPNQSLPELTARVLGGLETVLKRERPAMIAVQGDTTTTFAAALAGFYHRIPVGHVEAGLRTGDLAQPFPEELNRVLTTRLSALHFAPTRRSAANLTAEGIAADRIFVTGNTGIDALLYTRKRLELGQWPGYCGVLPPPGKHLILMTAHRRESFGEGFENICQAVLRIAARGDTGIIYPVHPNPNVRAVVGRRLEGVPGVTLIEPLDYVPFVDLMRRADILLTDSGGVQEEGPSFGKPVLVMRDKTERQEAVEAGTAILVGTEPDRIEAEVAKLLKSPSAREPFTRIENPFGDGHACPRIADAIHSFLNS